MSTDTALWTSTDAMRPTQGAVGYLEVRFKMLELRERAATPGSLEKYLRLHPIPAVYGPDGRMYLTDHHHMGLALVKLAQDWDDSDRPAARNPYRACSFQIIKDLSQRGGMSMRQFFLRMEDHHRCHPYDGTGHRMDRLPRSLTELVDDPYRSLAGLARKAGAYNKVDLPFTEFQWANYLRDKVPQTLITEQSIAQAIWKVVHLGNTAEAATLPGFRGIRHADQLPTLHQIEQRLAKRYGADDAAPGLPLL